MYEAARFSARADPPTPARRMAAAASDARRRNFMPALWFMFFIFLSIT
jgi:hypothetical protein